MQQQVVQLYNPLLNYVKKRVRNMEDAEDLTQDVFLKLAKSDEQQVNNLKSWVYTIARNTITDYYRKKQLAVDSMANEPPEELTTDTEKSKELATCVAAFIEELPEEYRELLILSELKNIPQKEIAEQLQMNYVTVRSKIQRGRKKLKQLFENCCEVIQGGKGSIVDFKKRSVCNKRNCDN